MISSSKAMTAILWDSEFSPCKCSREVGGGQRKVLWLGISLEMFQGFSPLLVLGTKLRALRMADKYSTWSNIPH
jgi:hypothetical protein